LSVSLDTYFLSLYNIPDGLASKDFFIMEFPFEVFINVEPQIFCVVFRVELIPTNFLFQFDIRFTKHNMA